MSVVEPFWISTNFPPHWSTSEAVLPVWRTSHPPDAGPSEMYEVEVCPDEELEHWYVPLHVRQLPAEFCSDVPGES